MSGGLSTKGPTVANALRYVHDGTTWTFVELTKNAPWFLKAVAGPKTQKGDLKTVTVLTEIRNEFLKACGETPDDETAVAESETPAAAPMHASDDGVDPMDALDEVPDKVATAKPKTKAKAKQKKKRTQRRRPFLAAVVFGR